MAFPADSHVSISSPDNTVFPSFKLSEFGNSDASQVLLSAVRKKCNMSVISIPYPKVTLDKSKCWKSSTKFKFSADGKTALVTDYDLAYYVSITPEVSVIHPSSNGIISVYLMV